LCLTRKSLFSINTRILSFFERSDQAPTSSTEFSILIAQHYCCKLHEFPSWLQDITVADCMVVAPSSAEFPSWLQSITVGARLWQVSLWKRLALWFLKSCCVKTVAWLLSLTGGWLLFCAHKLCRGWRQSSDWNRSIDALENGLLKRSATWSVEEMCWVMRWLKVTRSRTKW